MQASLRSRFQELSLVSAGVAPWFMIAAPRRGFRSPFNVSKKIRFRLWELVGQALGWALMPVRCWAGSRMARASVLYLRGVQMTCLARAKGFGPWRLLAAIPCAAPPSRKLSPKVSRDGKGGCRYEAVALLVYPVPISPDLGSTVSSPQGSHGRRNPGSLMRAKFPAFEACDQRACGIQDQTAARARKQGFPQRSGGRRKRRRALHAGA